MDAFEGIARFFRRGLHDGDVWRVPRRVAPRRHPELAVCVEVQVALDFRVLFDVCRHLKHQSYCTELNGVGLEMATLRPGSK